MAVSKNVTCLKLTRCTSVSRETTLSTWFEIRTMFKASGSGIQNAVEGNNEIGTDSLRVEGGDTISPVASSLFLEIQSKACRSLLKAGDKDISRIASSVGAYHELRLVVPICSSMLCPIFATVALFLDMSNIRPRMRIC